MFNTITKFYNMLGEINGIHTIKKKKYTKIYDGYTADDERSDDYDNDYKYKKNMNNDGNKCINDNSYIYDDNTIMIDGLEQILLKVLNL
jgi:hypothetical protein